MKEKIIIIGSAHPLRGGGIATFNERLAKELMQQGHDVEIFSFSLQYPAFLFPGSSQFTTDPPPPALKIQSRINSINPFNWISVAKAINRMRPTIVVVRYWLPFMAPCLGTILRIIRGNNFTRIVAIADNVIPHEPKPWDALLTRYFVAPVHQFIIMSKQVKTDLELFVKDKPIQLVPHPLYDNFGEKVSRQTAREALGIHPDTPILLFFGFIRKYKGLDILLNAFQRVKKSFPPGLPPLPMLLIAGEFYDNETAYLQLIDQLGIRENLLLHTHFIPDAAVKNYLCAADVVIQPYRTATQSGVTPLAYHFEIPMIVTNVGGLPDLVPHNRVGLVAEPTAESLAAAIIDFFSKGKEFFLPALIQEKQLYRWSNMANAITNVHQLPQ